MTLQQPHKAQAVTQDHTCTIAAQRISIQTKWERGNTRNPGGKLKAKLGRRFRGRRNEKSQHGPSRVRVSPQGPPRKSTARPRSFLIFRRAAGGVSARQTQPTLPSRWAAGGRAGGRAGRVEGARLWVVSSPAVRTQRPRIPFCSCSHVSLLHFNGFGFYCY